MPTDARSAQATLQWDYAASGAAGFVVYCGTARGSYSIRVDVGNTTASTVSGLVAGTTYYCATTAYDAAKKESTYSTEVVVSVPAAPPAGAPQVITRTPLPSATGVGVGTTITATFNEAVQQSTIAFSLTGPTGAVIPATLTYNPTTLTAALQVSAALATSTTYRATINGAKDTAGTAMTAPVTWTFTTAASQSACPCTIWPSTTTPIAQAAADSNSVELGVKFRTDVNGWVTGIRFYKHSLNTGTHIGTLWTATGTQLATATFVNETASGWQQVNFSVPVAVTAGTTYVASYHVSGGYFAADNGYFDNSSAGTGIVHALKSGTDGSNGLFVYSSAVTFPTQTYKSNNYWVDVAFTTTRPCPCTIWPASAIPTQIGSLDPSPIELGLKFRADVNGSITGVRFYKSRTNTGTHTGSLWTTGGTRLATATFVNETASGWQQVNFSPPVRITAGTTYIASYHTNTGHYSVNQGQFFGSGVDNAPLHALEEGVNGPNGVFKRGTTSMFPNDYYQSTNWWIDVVFTSP